MNVTVIDYKAGNLTSVLKALRHLGAEPEVTDGDLALVESAERIILPGEIPSPIDPPKGCPFHPRCPIAEPRCQTDPPSLREIAPSHFASCHLAK